MMSDLPGGSSVTAHVVNCVPMGNDGKYFLVGASLYTHGNVWGISNPPEDWGAAAQNDPKPATPTAAIQGSKTDASASGTGKQKKTWPYSLFSEGAEASLGRR